MDNEKLFEKAMAFFRNGWKIVTEKESDGSLLIYAIQGKAELFLGRYDNE